jgi:hypothetical protein
MIATMSSLRPGGVESESISVMNPYGYARFASASIFFAVLAIAVSLRRLAFSLHPSGTHGDLESRI